ncbi:MAG TPA: hypothetical protein VGW12_00235 [Pyrinomonadaceae bacterium]|nr:hypothetical protein [Pyrinomonadaceae bacterium]
MAEPKTKPERRVAGKSKFRLPERPPRVVEINPLREILQEAKAQEDALTNAPSQKKNTPAKRIAGVSQSAQVVEAKSTPAKDVAGVVRQVIDKPASTDQATFTTSFKDFYKRWSPILRSGQMSVCRALFEMTHAVGQEECFTSMPKLAIAANLKERQCYNVVGQLEILGFIERPEIFNTPNKKGTIFRLFLTPQMSTAGVNRKYHIGGDEE